MRDLKAKVQLHRNEKISVVHPLDEISMAPKARPRPAAGAKRGGSSVEERLDVGLRSILRELRGTEDELYRALDEKMQLEEESQQQAIEAEHRANSSNDLSETLQLAQHQVGQLSTQLTAARRRLGETESWGLQLEEVRGLCRKRDEQIAGLRDELKQRTERAALLQQALDAEQVRSRENQTRYEFAAEVTAEESSASQRSHLKQLHEQGRALQQAQSTAEQLRLDVKERDATIQRMSERETRLSASLAALQRESDVEWPSRVNAIASEVSRLEHELKQSIATAAQQRDVLERALAQKDDQLLAAKRDNERKEAVLRGRLDWQLAATEEMRAKLRTYREALDLSQYLRGRGDSAGGGVRADGANGNGALPELVSLDLKATASGS